MEISINTRKLAAVNRDNRKEHRRNELSRDTNVSRVNDEYITQLSEEIEERMTIKLSQKFSKINSRILGAVLKLHLHEFLLNSQLWVQSGTNPETSRNSDRENQEYNEDHSQNDPHPYVDTSVNRSLHTMNLDPDLVHHNYTFDCLLLIAV